MLHQAYPHLAGKSQFKQFMTPRAVFCLRWFQVGMRFSFLSVLR